MCYNNLKQINVKGEKMKNELLEEISTNLVSVIPSLHKQVFKSFPMDRLPLNLARSSTEVLLMLDEMRSTTVRELCKQMQISGPNMTPLIDKLVQNKLVNRKPDEEDRRVIQIEITPEGDLYCAKMREILMDVIKEKFASLHDEDLIELKKALVTLSSVLMKMNS